MLFTSRSVSCDRSLRLDFTGRTAGAVRRPPSATSLPLRLRAVEIRQIRSNKIAVMMSLPAIPRLPRQGMWAPVGWGSRCCAALPHSLPTGCHRCAQHGFSQRRRRRSTNLPSGRWLANTRPRVHRAPSCGVVLAFPEAIQVGSTYGHPRKCKTIHLIVDGEVREWHDASASFSI